MKLDQAEYLKIVADVRRELLPVLREELREELVNLMRCHRVDEARRENAIRFIRLPEVLERVGYKSAKVWSMVKAGEFPAALKLGPKVTVWREHEVNEWVARRAA